MRVFEKISETHNFLKTVKARGLSVGFVPTMGALHRGHISLIEQSLKENNFTVCSIFVNPIQFNKKSDLKNYPRETTSDFQKLKSSGCNMVFMPSNDEMYPEPVNTQYDFGQLDKVMEGKHRPGHFNGVAIVVRKLFEIIMPDKAYFGEKDFQQLAIIQYLVKKNNIPVNIVPCPIIRENDGLAMSSRNVRLTPAERKEAPVIFQLLKQAKEKVPSLPVEASGKWIKEEFNKYPSIKFEYFEIVDMETLQPVKEWGECKKIIACVAVHLGKIRLIDNIILIS
ncbi:MAG: pantoate--beta-alanine ligase [Bacteroidales bacterium]|nr:pantoate--beta-alanine ligase [Bacteroidales bacterium]